MAKQNKSKVELVGELTPELANKIFRSIQKSNYDKKVSKEAVLHHLKQVKAQIGKVRKQVGFQNDNTRCAIDAITRIIDQKIAKLDNI